MLLPTTLLPMTLPRTLFRLMPSSWNVTRSFFIPNSTEGLYFWSSVFDAPLVVDVIDPTATTRALDVALPISCSPWTCCTVPP